jgi:hypothetical protein
MIAVSAGRGTLGPETWLPFTSAKHTPVAFCIQNKDKLSVNQRAVRAGPAQPERIRPTRQNQNQNQKKGLLQVKLNGLVLPEQLQMHD